jgi:hypothetical protein
MDLVLRAIVKKAALKLPSVENLSQSLGHYLLVPGCFRLVLSCGLSKHDGDARTTPGPANIAWLASLCVDSKVTSLTIFNGPLTDVPQLVSQCVVVGDSLQFKLEFCPRAYGAYNMRRPDGKFTKGVVQLEGFRVVCRG